MTPGLRQWWRHTRLRRVVPWSLTLSNMKEKRSSTHYERRRASSGGPLVLLPSWAYPGKRSNRRSKSWESSGTASRRPDLPAGLAELAVKSEWQFAQSSKLRCIGRIARDPAETLTQPRIQRTPKKRPVVHSKGLVIERLSTGAALALNRGDDPENRISV